jgi:hypothetical protein
LSEIRASYIQSLIKEERGIISLEEIKKKAMAWPSPYD